VRRFGDVEPNNGAIVRIPRVVTTLFASALMAGTALGGTALTGAALTGSASAASSVTSLTFTTTMTSIETNLQTLPGGHTYGWNHFTGTTTWGNQSATIVFLGDVDYVNGSGPFGGYVTVTRADGTKLAFTTKGNALAEDKATDGIAARFASSLEVIGGTNAYARATGIGTMTGTRASEIGSPAKFVFKLSVRK
jgi:hypothetical protein